MFLKSTIFLSLSIFAVFSTNGLKKRLKKEDVYKNGRMDVALKSKNHNFEPLMQNQCPDEWKDATSVGLGCVYADIRDYNIDEATAENICKDFGEGGRLVEIINEEQMYFLQNWLEAVELVHNFNGYIWWWIGLNDIEEEGKYVWPVNGPVNYTHWDEEYIYDGEPYDYYGNYDCVEMQSAEIYSLLWLAMECDDTQDTYAVCQLPYPM